MKSIYIQKYNNFFWPEFGEINAIKLFVLQESSEYSELKAALNQLSQQHKLLSDQVKNSLKQLSESSEYQKKFETDFSDVENWLKNKNTELSKGAEFDPLKVEGVSKTESV